MNAIKVDTGKKRVDRKDCLTEVNVKGGSYKKCLVLAHKINVIYFDINLMFLQVKLKLASSLNSSYVVQGRLSTDVVLT